MNKIRTPMMQYKSCGLTTVVTFCGAMSLTSAAYSEDSPNIVFILADDLGAGDLSFLNPDGKLSTPNIDALAREGMVFTDAHTSSSVCTPTRYGLLTGRYNWRSDLKNGVLQGYSRALIHSSRDTVADLLKRNGYSTAMVGKWHLGLNWRLKDGGEVKDLREPPGIEKNIDFSKPFAGGPCDHGFDSWYGVNASLDFPPYTILRNDRVSEIPTVKRPFQGGKDKKNIMMRSGLQSIDFAPEKVMIQLTDHVVQYIKDIKKDKPFFLYFALVAPHTPVCPSKDFRGTSKCGIYGDYIQELDWSVGRVVKALKTKGIFKNTLLIFTADNGASKASFSEEDEKKFGHNPSGIYRGRKGCLYEGGHRVPFIACWPNKIKPASKCTVPCCLNDFYATCAAITGSKTADDAGVDSYSLLPLFSGNTKGYTRTDIVHHDYAGRFAIRSGKWKLILSKNKNNNALYNIDTDLSETKNLMRENPEITENLKRKLTHIIQNGRSNPGPKQKNDGEQHWKQLFWIPAPDKVGKEQNNSKGK